MNMYPHGKCECPEHPDCKGPSALEVTRDGHRIKVCTRCDLSTDQDVKLLIQDSDCIKPYWDYDRKGLLYLGMKEAFKDKKS